MLLLGRHLLPKRPLEESDTAADRSIFDLWTDYNADREYRSGIIKEDSPLVGTSIRDSALETRFGVRILGIVRQLDGREQRLPSPPSSTVLESGDTVLFVARAAELERLMTEQSLSPSSPSQWNVQRWLWELGAATVLVHPESELIGKSLSEAEFRSRYNLHVLGVRRDRKALGNHENIRLAPSLQPVCCGPLVRHQAPAVPAP